MKAIFFAGAIVLALVTLSGCRPIEDDEADYVRHHSCTAGKHSIQNGEPHTEWYCEAHPLAIDLPDRKLKQ